MKDLGGLPVQGEEPENDNNAVVRATAQIDRQHGQGRSGSGPPILGGREAQRSVSRGTYKIRFLSPPPSAVRKDLITFAPTPLPPPPPPATCPRPGSKPPSALAQTRVVPPVGLTASSPPYNPAPNESPPRTSLRPHNEPRIHPAKAWPDLSPAHLPSPVSFRSPSGSPASHLRALCVPQSYLGASACFCLEHLFPKLLSQLAPSQHSSLILLPFVSFFFFFLAMSWHTEVPRPRIESVPQQ